MEHTLVQRAVIPMEDRPGGLLTFLYGSLPGRLLLRGLTRPAVSRLAGRFLDSRLSARAIDGFVRRHGIDLSQYEPPPYPSYNAFFTRRIRPELRPVDPDPNHLIAPCDCKLSAYPVDADSRFWIKDAPYTLSELLGGDPAAERYRDGVCLICRLAVDDYHRYCYIDDGEKSDNRFISGVLHTVQPIALSHCNIYKRNCREYTTLYTRRFGEVIQVEVGALMVGRIRNHHGVGSFHRGEEKGLFEFGGSTIVLLLQKGAAVIDPDILDNTCRHCETVVRMGERIGLAAK